MNSTVYKLLTEGKPDMTEEAKKFLHMKEGQKDWIKERLRQCPLSKLQSNDKN